MTPARLRQVGESLYGRGWQRRLGGDLGVTARTIRYWLSGRSPVPPRIGPQLDRLVATRAAGDHHALESLLARRGFRIVPENLPAQ